MLREKIVKLTTPVTFGDQKIAEFTLIEPTLDALEKVESLSGIAYFKRLMAACSISPKLDAPAIGRLSSTDYATAMAALVEVMRAEPVPTEE